MQILHFLTIQHHLTAKDKNGLHVLQEHCIKQNKQHSIMTQFRNSHFPLFSLHLKGETNQCFEQKLPLQLK